MGWAREGAMTHMISFIMLAVRKEEEDVEQLLAVGAVHHHLVLLINISSAPQQYRPDRHLPSASPHTANMNGMEERSAAHQL
jgi:hypothetical protein